VSPNTLLPLGPANGQVDFFARGACAQPGVDPAIFTSEEDDDQAVTAARTVCSRCPVRLPCRRYAEAANPYGVYAGETQTERAARLQLRPHLAARKRRPAGAGGVSASAACRVCGGPVDPDQPRRPAFAHPWVAAHGGAAAAAAQPEAPP
jgi:WhiB family redox-sensing transcriptional regulator